MSALNSFRILSKKDNVIVVEVCLIHPDEHHINDSYNFALQILVELYEFVKLDYLHSIAYSPLAKDAHEKLLLEENKPLLEHLLALMRGNNQTHQPQFDAFCEQADTHIMLVEVLCVDDFPHWADRFETWLKYQKPAHHLTNEEFAENPESKERPSYHLQITVNPASDFLLNHVVEGCKWDSAAYNFWNYTQSYEEKNQSIRHCLNYDTDAVPPTDEILQAWWNGLNEAWKQIFLRNLHLQKKELSTILLGYSLGQSIDFIISTNLANEITMQDLRLISQLKYLNGSSYQINEISPLGMLKGLKILELENPHFSDIAVLKDLINLEYLSIFGNDSIKDFSALQHLKKLQYLHFLPQKQEDLENIRFLENIRELNFGTLFFEFDYAIFEQFPKLKKLSGFAQPLSDSEMNILKNLHQKGVIIDWNTYDEENDDWIVLEF
ncbi:MAG: hypothetical protein EAZ85_06605 [Bacteroidetes bacterium]|nr:MAG: hypothetical protein EAZ85_06605 [Bacteroidota bacterium]TAG87568.1 MAG: hypothetical protein EAZ20_10385 [Bacteroidota bacterium]